MRRFFGKFTFFPVIVILVGFVWFTLKIGEPQQKVQRKSLVTGSIHAADPLKPDGPFIPYIALHKGVLGAQPVPDFPLDDAQPDGDGKFELSADNIDGRQFFLLVRFETANSERWCKTVPLPKLRRTAEGLWLDATTGKRLPPLRIAVDKSQRCD